MRRIQSVVCAILYAENCFKIGSRIFLCVSNRIDPDFKTKLFSLSFKHSQPQSLSLFSLSLLLSFSFLNDFLKFFSFLFLDHIIELQLFILCVSFHLLNKLLFYLFVQKLFYLLQLLGLLSDDQHLRLFLALKQVRHSRL